MKRAWLVFRSAILWIVSGLHFFLVVPALILFGIFLDTRKHDWLQRGFCRRIAFLSGAQVEAEGFRELAERAVIAVPRGLVEIESL